MTGTAARAAESALIDKIGDLLRVAAAEAIMPRYRKLRDGETMEKAPGEIVTVADREAERIIEDGLRVLKPGAVIVGEEAASLRPELLDELGGEGYAFLVDPLDGTRNFASGKSPFSVMAAMLDCGVPCAAWMLDPLTDELAVAERGSGAFLDGARLRTAPGFRPARFLTGTVSGRFLPPEVRARVRERAGAFAGILPPPSCAGHEYTALARGGHDFTLFWRTLPWDHAPGTLFLAEAGGRAARPDGSPYLPADGRAGLLAAANAEVWEEVAGLLLGGGRSFRHA